MVEKLLQTIEIDGRPIGGDCPCYVVAEIGINHNGDMNLAKAAISAAMAAGADAVKFQNYHTEQFISDKSLLYEYISQGAKVVESQFDMFKRYELTREQLGDLKSFTEAKGIGFHSTPMDVEGLQDLVDLHVSVLKNGSDCLTHLPLLKAMANTGLPVVISTGMGTLGDIDAAVRTVREAGNDQIVLLHCTSSYPTPLEDVNIRKIPTLRSAFGCHVGFSDHTDGTAAAVGAVALGACWIEKHFTLDKDLEGPDHRFSADPNELAVLIKSVRDAQQALGSEIVRPTPSESLGIRDFRLSCVAATDLQAGHKILENDIAYKRPGTGLPPAVKDQLVGRTVLTSITSGTQLSWEDVK